MILRITRTFPRIKYNGIGLSSYYLQKFSKEKNFIFTKKINSRIFKLNKKNRLWQIHYKDLKFKEKNTFSFIFIFFSKIYGEVVFLLNILFIIRKKKIQFSIIHVHSINYILTGIILKKLYKAKLFLNLGGTDFYRMKKYNIFNFIIKRVDNIFTVSKKITNEFKKNGDGNKCVYTSNGIEKNIFENLNLHKEKQFVAVGNLRWQKNYIKMIKAFNIFLKKRSGFKLIIIGEGEEKENILKAIKNLNLSQKVILLGYQKHNKIAKIINQSKVFLMSSKSEGMPKSLMEAIACGTPVISTDVGDCKYISKNCGIILNRNISDTKYANAMISMIDNKFNYKKFKKNCLKKSKQFSWNAYAEKVIYHYKTS